MPAARAGQDGEIVSGDVDSSWKGEDWEWHDDAATPGGGPSGPASRAIVPPVGALPRRFGASSTLLWAGRAVTVGAPVALAIGVVLLVVAPGSVPDWALDLIKGAAVPLALVAISRLFSSRRQPPRAVVFEPSGVFFHYELRVDAYGWGELIEIVPSAEHASVWNLVVRRGADEKNVPLDASKTWMDQLVRELTGDLRPGGDPAAASL